MTQSAEIIQLGDYDPRKPGTYISQQATVFRSIEGAHRQLMDELTRLEKFLEEAAASGYNVPDIHSAKAKVSKSLKAFEKLHFAVRKHSENN